MGCGLRLGGGDRKHFWLYHTCSAVFSPRPSFGCGNASNAVRGVNQLQGTLRTWMPRGQREALLLVQTTVMIAVGHLPRRVPHPAHWRSGEPVFCVWHSVRGNSCSLLHVWRALEQTPAVPAAWPNFQRRRLAGAVFPSAPRWWPISRRAPPGTLASTSKSTADAWTCLPCLVLRGWGSCSSFVRWHCRRRYASASRS